MGAAADVQAMPKQKKKQTGPPKTKGALSDKKKRRSSEKPRERHDAPAPAKKQRSSWVPATERQRKAARMREALKPHQGHSKTIFEMMLVFSLVLGLYVFYLDGRLQRLANETTEPSWPRFYRFAADLLSFDKAQTKEAWDMLWDSDENVGLNIRVADACKRGRGSAEFPLGDARLLKPEHHTAIDAYVAQCHSKKGGRVTLRNLQQHLEKNFQSPDDPDAPFVVSRDALRYCMVNQLGYHWGKVRLKKRSIGAHRPGQIRSYLKKYDEALSLERAGLAVVVYFDEVSADNFVLVISPLEQCCSFSPLLSLCAAEI